MVLTSDSAALKAGLKTDSPKCVGKEGPGEEREWEGRKREKEWWEGRRKGERETDGQTDRQTDRTTHQDQVNLCGPAGSALGNPAQSLTLWVPSINQCIVSFPPVNPPNFPGLHGESHSCSYRRSTNPSHSYCSTSGNCILEGDLNFSHSYFKVYMPSPEAKANKTYSQSYESTSLG